MEFQVKENLFDFPELEMKVGEVVGEFDVIDGNQRLLVRIIICRKGLNN